MTAKTRFDARTLMEQAIEVMRQSVPEPRTDGKTDPKVGAVLYKPDGTVETACRGELRHGDHAEFTLLERKNRSNELDGSILFATLEPCAKGSRIHPKMSCAERVVLARIKEVWVGIQDPDPTVARKGIGYLIRQGVTVHMFDRDLQEVIERENAAFLKQATERAAEVRERPAKTMLSPLEDKLPNVFVRNKAHRQQRQALPFEMVREAVANALIHRDYDIEGAKCQMVVTEDTVTVQSPGKPPPPITLEQLQDFSAPMLSRNPELHFVFARMGMAEEQGLGLASLRDQAKKLGLPVPKYAWDDPYLVLTLYRSAEGATKALDEETLKALSKSERKGWQWLAARGKAKSGEYAEAMGVEPRTARRHLGHFEELGLVTKTGSGPSQQYEVK